MGQPEAVGDLHYVTNLLICNGHVCTENLIRID
jgi:hypothetical protein